MSGAGCSTGHTLTSVEGGGVVDVRGDEGGLGLSAHRVVPHPPDAALSQHTKAMR